MSLTAHQCVRNPLVHQTHVTTCFYRHMAADHDHTRPPTTSTSTKTTYMSIQRLPSHLLYKYKHSCYSSTVLDCIDSCYSCTAVLNHMYRCYSCTHVLGRKPLHNTHFTGPAYERHFKYRLPAQRLPLSLLPVADFITGLVTCASASSAAARQSLLLHESTADGKLKI